MSLRNALYSTSARAEAEIGDDEEQAAGEIAIAGDEEQQAGGRAARVAEERHQPLLQVRVIGDRAEHRQQKDLQEHRQADAERKERLRRDEKRPELEDDAVLADVRLASAVRYGPDITVMTVV